MKKETIEFVERKGGILTLNIDGKERQFLVNEENVKYFTYSSSIVKAGELQSRDAIVKEILSTRQGSYGQEFVFGQNSNIVQVGSVWSMSTPLYKLTIKSAKQKTAGN